MGIDNISILRLTNRMFIEAAPVFKNEPNEEICMKFSYVGAVMVKAVYIDSDLRLIRRVGDRIYVSFPYGTDKESVLRSINSEDLAAKVRRYIKVAMKLSYFPTRNMTGSLKDGFIVLEGKRYNVRVIPALMTVIALEGDTYYFTYRLNAYTAEKRFTTWRRDITFKAFQDAIDRVCDINGLPRSSLKFTVTNGSMFIYKNKTQAHLCIPEGASALSAKDLNSIALYFVLCHEYKYSLEGLKKSYSFLFEVACYVAKRVGLRIDRNTSVHQMDKVYSDNYLARHGEKAYCVIDQIIAGKSINADKILHLCSSISP